MAQDVNPRSGTDRDSDADSGTDGNPDRDAGPGSRITDQRTIPKLRHCPDCP